MRSCKGALVLPPSNLIQLLFALHLFAVPALGQERANASDVLLPLVENVDAQPLLQHALTISEALSFVGSALPASSIDRLRMLGHQSHDEVSVEQIQDILDPFVLAMVDISPESRVKVLPGPAQKILMQEGWSTFLVKVRNQANVTARLIAESPHALPTYQPQWGERILEEDSLSPGQIDNRFLEISVYRNRPLQPHLSGLELEYAIIHIYTRDTGRRMAEIGFNVGQGTQDIGFRNAAQFLFDIKPAVKVVLDVRDENNSSAMASFIITDDIERYAHSELTSNSMPWRFPWRNWESSDLSEIERADTLHAPDKLSGIYPLPAKRLAEVDEYPDFFFQPQVYRTSGEHVYLPPGTYNVIFGRGPEYLSQSQEITISDNVDSVNVSFRLKRWIHMANLGWYSTDHHIHSAGCEHYDIPWEGVRPEHMFRQIQGEDLNLGIILNWGPGWYYQKQFFTGKDVHELSTANNILRYDVEVSRFPSSHAGHLGLINLREDDYPNTTKIEEWPSWTLPVVEWAKEQGGISGYVHSGWGLAPVGREHRNYSQEAYAPELPNYEMPRMDGIGANEYVVTITHDAIDFYGLGNTPIVNELNMWYHSLSSGFRTRISGESDFPCITDEKVGPFRTYAHLPQGLSFPDYVQALKDGRSYVSDGFSHLIDFEINGLDLGENGSEISVSGGTSLDISVEAAAFLPEAQGERGAFIAGRAPNEQPFWHIERARIGSSREVLVELVVNGEAVEGRRMVADGAWHELAFDYEIDKSSWIAFRIHGSSHTNPIFVLVDGAPIRVRESAQWMRDAVDRCWEMKMERIRDSELDQAKAAYDHAKKTYDRIIAES